MTAISVTFFILLMGKAIFIIFQEFYDQFKKYSTTSQHEDCAPRPLKAQLLVQEGWLAS